MNKYKDIEDIRKTAGTLPSEKPIRKTNFKVFPSGCEVAIIDQNLNPLRAMFCTSTATWGDNDYEDKWPRTTVEGKFEVIKAVLTHNTLPQAREMINFIFRVNGVPRWLFDQHTQTPFTSFMSIGCRDNNKIDCDFITTENDGVFTEEEMRALEGMKDLYANVLTIGEGSWQSARTFLPQGYQHAYHFGQNLLSISSMKFLNEQMSDLYRMIVSQIGIDSPLLQQYLQILWKDNDEVFDKISNMKYEDLSIWDKLRLEDKS